MCCWGAKWLVRPAVVGPRLLHSCLPPWRPDAPQTSPPWPSSTCDHTEYPKCSHFDQRNVGAAWFRSYYFILLIQLQARTGNPQCRRITLPYNTSQYFAQLLRPLSVLLQVCAGEWILEGSVGALGFFVLGPGSARVHHHQWLASRWLGLESLHHEL